MNETVVLTFTEEEIRKLVEGTGVKITNKENLQSVIKAALGIFISNVGK